MTPADLIDGYVYNIGFAGGDKGYLEGKTGSLFGIPYGSETSILGYRKDIFEKHGLEVPETYDEMLDIACKIPSWSRAWAVCRRARPRATTPATRSCCTSPLGGRVSLTTHWNPIVNNEAGVEAAEALKKIVDCGPEGAARISVLARRLALS